VSLPISIFLFDFGLEYLSLQYHATKH